MAGPSRLAAAGALAAVLGACSSAPPPEVGERPTKASSEIERTKEAAREGTAAELPEAVDAETPATAPAAPAVDPTAPVRFATARSEPEEPEEPTLFEAAQAERARRQAEGAPSAVTVITDANLAEYARGGHLTVSSGNDDPTAAEAEAATAAGPEDPEVYWRTRVRDARLAWRAAADRTAELEKEVARLRFEFYSQDDPAYRDLEIKPAWDRSLVELAQARMHTRDLESQVETILAEGYEAGALPGWLREGIDFEPEAARDREPEADDPGTAQVIEPPILQDPPR